MLNQKNDLEKVLLDQNAILKAVEQLAQRISTDYQHSKLILVAVLKGSVVFLADLIRKLSIPVQIDFLKVSTYSGTQSTHKLKIQLDFQRKDLHDKDILIVEDIIDTGFTLLHLVQHIKAKGPRSVKTCAFLDKPERREAEIDADYRGVVIPNEFVVGYGLDYNQQYRNLPLIGVLKKSVYQK